MHVLYGSRGSGSAAVEAALLRCGLPFREVRASTWEDDSAQDELRRINPLGQIPTLVLPDAGVMTESAAILIHLGLEHPQSALLPADAAARAQAIRGLVFVAANCYAAIGIIDYPERWSSGGDKAMHDSIIRGTRRRLHSLWDQFGDQFGALLARPGQPTSALDILSAVVSRWAGARAHAAKSRPQLAAAWQAVEADPLLAPVFARHWPAPAAAGTPAA